MIFRNRAKKRGFSLMELLAVVTILGIIAAIIIPRVSDSSAVARQQVRNHHAATINSAVERWFIDNNSWPANDLSDIGADLNYFPEGLPINPSEGGAYAIDGATRRVIKTGWVNP